MTSIGSDFVTDEQRAFAARLLASMGQPVIATDTEFRIIYWSRGAEHQLGWTAEEMLGIDILSAGRIRLSDERAESLLERLAAGDEVIEEFQVSRKDGSRVPVLVQLTPLFDGDRSFVGLVAVATDLTERREMESAHARLSAIVESSGDGIVGFDSEGLITSWNHAAEQLFGLLAEERVGTMISTGALRNSEQWAAAVAEVFEGGSPSPFEAEFPRPAGGTLRVSLVFHPVRDDSGSTIGGAVVCRDVSARHELERSAAQEHQRLEEAQEIANIGNFDFDLESGTMVASHQLRRIFFVGTDEEPDVESFFTKVHPDDQERIAKRFSDWLEQGEVGSDFDATYRIASDDSGVRWVHTIARLDGGADGRPRRIIGSSQDITERRQQEEARLRAERQFSVAFDLGGVGMLLLDLDRRIVQVNDALCVVLGRSPEELLGHVPDDFAHPAEIEPPGRRPSDQLVASGRDHLAMERRYLRPDGEVVHTIVHLAVVPDETGEPAYTFAQLVDITGRKRAEQDLERLAMHDPLTGLPNRNLLHDRLASALARRSRGRSHVAVIFVDVDHFKLVNDSLGHSTGDELLRQLAGRLARSTRGGDTVARFGGDEFVLVCCDVSDTAEASLIGARVAQLFDEPFVLDGQELYVTVSCGIVVASPDDTPVTVLRDADTAMYRAKERGRARSEVFDEALRARASRRLGIELALRHGLERHEFRLVYQPILALETGAPVAFEALIRWDHPDRGLVSPSEFIPAAEETGLIIPIGNWVLDEAIAQMAKWRQAIPAMRDMQVGVNVSARQLMTGDVLVRARHVLREHHLPADRLCLEITETVAMTDVDVSIPILRRIADTGIQLAVDDFGSGYSSLSYLKQLPVGMLKIDRSFVDGLGTDEDDSKIVRAIVGLGHAMNLQLCAEGVETAAQAAALSELGCHTAQGYYWAEPMTPEQVVSWVSSGVAAAAVAAASEAEVAAARAGSDAKAGSGAQSA